MSTTVVSPAPSTVGTGLTLVDSQCNGPTATLVALSTSTSCKWTIGKLTRNTTAANVLVNQATGTKLSESSGLWRGALDDYLGRLKPEERKLCTPLPLDATLDQEALNRFFVPLYKEYDQGYYQRILNRVEPIAKHVLSFGKAIDIAIGSGGSLGAGVIWGAIRVVLDISCRSVALQEKAIDQLEKLSHYLGLFDRWLKVFPSEYFKPLSHCLQETCVAFVGFIVEAIRFFRRSSLRNTLEGFFSPGLGERLTKCEAQIKRQTEFLERELSTASFEANQKHHFDLQSREKGQLKEIQSIKTLLIARKRSTIMPADFSFRYHHHCPRNNQFYGRVDEIALLDSHLCQSRLNGPLKMESIVIHGSGGCGKSSLAKEYMYRQFDSGQYAVIIWLYADSVFKLGTQFIELAKQLKIETNEADARDAVLHWIQNLDRSFLIIFDNADVPAFLTDFWPCSTLGSIIITSRNPRAQEVNLASHALHLTSFAQEQGVGFLRTVIPRSMTSKEDLEAIEWISSYFGGLPLALRQASAHVIHKNCSPAQYRQLYESMYEDLDEYRPPTSSQNDKTTAEVWQMSISVLSEDARTLLDIMSLLDPDAIPEELLEVADIEHPYSDILKNQLRVLDAREILTSQSLINIDSQSNTISIHRLHKEFTYRGLRKDVKRLHEVVFFCISILHSFTPNVNLLMIRSPQHWKPIKKILSHVDSIYDQCKNVFTKDEAGLMVGVMTKVLNYGFESAQYDLGDKAFENIQELALMILAPDDETMALVYFIHGRLCCETSRQQQAVQELLQSYAHLNKAAATKPDLLNTTLHVRILSTLGMAHTAVGHFIEAEDYHKRAIAHCTALKSEEKCSMGNLVQNLASCYLWGGRMDEAEVALIEARKHPNTAPEAIDYTHGNWMLKKRRYKEAARLHRATLEAYIKSLGANHPVAADSWHKMGTIFALKESEVRDLEEAEHCFRQDLKIRLSTCGLQEDKASQVVYKARPTNTGADNLLARSQLSLGALLTAMGGAEREQEAANLTNNAAQFVDMKFPGGLPAGVTAESAINDLIFYWSK